MNRVMPAQERKLTLAEVCEALASGKIAATVEDGNYHIRRSDLRGLLRLSDSSQVNLAKRRTELAS